jgi:NAD(P)H-nitrite reductase large subunit
MEDEIILCRCEDVTWGEIREHLQNGWTDAEEIKRLTRAGMGRCQGMTCRNLIAKEIAGFQGKKEGRFPPFTFRPPAVPVSLGLLGESEDD